jgi:cytochrome c oxidase assembly protein subunit 11
MNGVPRLLSRLGRSGTAPGWICSSCANLNSVGQKQATPFFQSSIRMISNTSKPRQHNAAPTMEQLRAPFKSKNSSTLYYTLSIILGTVAFSYGSVPMYKMVSLPHLLIVYFLLNCNLLTHLQICQTTGWGGQPIKAPGHGGGTDGGDPSERLKPVTTAPRIRITFNGSVSDVLNWKFTPQQREVRVLPGETALAFYTATNKSPEDIIGVATYSVTPAQVSPYFAKIQCFCFEEQRLNAGETVDMPVFFYIDPDFVNDPSMKGIEQVTLSYTFFSKWFEVRLGSVCANWK